MGEDNIIENTKKRYKVKNKAVIIRYNKDQVINLAKENTSFFVDERALRKWLDNIIIFLNSERAQKVLEWNNEEINGDYFLNEEMNLNINRNPTGQKDYDYNIITAITLSSLLILYENDYFQHLLKGEYAPVVKAETWTKCLEDVIEKFRVHWDESLKKGLSVKRNKIRKMEKRSWDIININILSQLYKLTLPKINEAIIEALGEEVQVVTDKFLSLDDDSKNKAYRKIKTRLKYIDNQIDDIIEDMDYVERFEYNTNLQRKKRN